MRIYCKPYLNDKNILNGNVIDMITYTEDYPIVFIDDIYETLYDLIVSKIEVDGELVNELDENGNIIYIEEPYQSLKECAVEFEVVNEDFLIRNTAEILHSTYWRDKFGYQSEYEKIQSDYSNGIKTIKCKEVEAKIKVAELENKQLVSEDKLNEKSDLNSSMQFEIIQNLLQRVEQLEGGV